MRELSTNAFLSYLSGGLLLGLLLLVVSCGSSFYSNPGPVGVQVYPACQVEVLQIHQGFNSNGVPVEGWITIDVTGERAQLCLIRNGLENCIEMDAETVLNGLLEVEDLFGEDVTMEEGEPDG